MRNWLSCEASNKLAIPGRLELPTCGLGNRRSIRLSYGTEELRHAGLAAFIAEHMDDRYPEQRANASRPRTNEAWPSQSPRRAVKPPVRRAIRRLIGALRCRPLHRLALLLQSRVIA